MTESGNKTTFSSAGAARQFPCGQCGALLVWTPGAQSLACTYCGHANAAPASDAPVEELDYRAQLSAAAEGEQTETHATVKCRQCAGEVDRPPNVTSFECPFCGSSLVVESELRRRIRPRSLLPFLVERKDATARFAAWLKKRWFAPSGLKKFARADRLNGIYVPFWTYDSQTVSQYTGQRGDDYYVTQTYTTMVNGKPQVRTRQVRHTRWTPAAGVVRNAFDDILILASRSLPKKFVDRLAPWDLAALVAYADAYLSGFRAESYQINLEEGFESAKEIMEVEIRATVCRDIGGDHQRIHTLDTRYPAITFKHILLPVWVSAYRYRNRVFRFVVNARTGEVQGERPWSAWKILGAVLLGAAIVGGIILIIQARS